MEGFITADFADTIKSFADEGLLGGVYLAVPTGNVMEEDETFIEVMVYGHSIYAKPCMAFGSYNVPTKEWLDKHKDEVLVWVAFENGNPAHPVYLGVAPNDKKAPAKNAYFCKSVDYELVVSDDNRNLSLEHNKQNVFSYSEAAGIQLLSGVDSPVLGNKNEIFLTKLFNILLSAQTADQTPLSPTTIAQLTQLQTEIISLKSQKIKIE